MKTEQKWNTYMISKTVSHLITIIYRNSSTDLGAKVGTFYQGHSVDGDTASVRLWPRHTALARDDRHLVLLGRKCARVARPGVTAHDGWEPNPGPVTRRSCAFTVLRYGVQRRIWGGGGEEALGDAPLTWREKNSPALFKQRKIWSEYSEWNRTNCCHRIHFKTKKFKKFDFGCSSTRNPPG